MTLFGQSARPVVAVHDSEYTRALENMNASGATPTGPGTTGKQWWPTTWHYYTMPEAVKEMLRSDGTAFTVVGDSNIMAGDLVVNGQPRYPIVISLASEAIRNEEIAQFTNYVAAGGFLFVGSSSFTRNTNGTGRGNFAFANELGVTMATSNLDNWGQNSYFEKDFDHRLVEHIPSGRLYWDMPASADEISWGISPSHVHDAPHPIWRVQATSATRVAGDIDPVLLVKPYGNGYFIYHAAMQPIVGHGGWAPGMYAYMFFRKAIEWAFESARKPVLKLSPWPYQYDSAFIVRHDLENYYDLISLIEGSAQFEAANGARGDYYFCTGTLREDMPNKTAAIAGIRSAVTNYGATIGPHNGGLKNPRNGALTHPDYDYWHWGPDEALDVTPSGYSSGKSYAQSSLATSFADVESWLSGITPSGPRNWCVCYFNGTRDDSYDIQVNLNVKITGEQKLSPFPHWTLSTKTSKYYPLLQIPVSDWYVTTLVAQSMGEHAGVGTLRAAIDYYYNNGLLINIYSHALSDSGLPSEYVTYSKNASLHPRLWSTNSIGLYYWWLQRSNIQTTVSYSTNGNLCTATMGISGSANANTAVEFLLPDSSYSGLQVFLNGVLAGGSSYRTNGELVRVRVGTTTTNVVVSYLICPTTPYQQIYSQNFDSVTAPNLPAGWTSSSTGAQTGWTTSTAIRDTLPNAAFSAEAGAVGVSDLTSPSIAIPAGQSQLTFRHNYDTELGWDGGVLEMKIGSNAFTDITSVGGIFVGGSYTTTLGGTSGNPLAGRLAWTGNSGGFVTTTVELPASAAGKNVQFKWRCATDANTTGNGWRVDTISISNRTVSCTSAVNTNAPVLPAQTNRTVAELTPLTVVNTATDADAGDALFYTLLAAPAAATIDSQGIISWTPGEGDGGTVNKFTTRVTDSGSPQLSATNSFTVTVLETNAGPILPVQNNRLIAEGSMLTVTNSATDPDVPPNALTYTLLAAPPSANISAQGIITWATTEANGPSTNVFTTRVTDNGVPSLSATNSFTVTVTEVNSAPALPAQTDRTIAGFATLTVTNTATDADLPANVLSYSLPIAPAGATISPAGVITWTAGGGASTNVFRTVVADNGSPQLRATNNFTVTVSATPAPTPVLDSIRLVAESCVVTNNAIDPGELVTVEFAFRNIGLLPTTNLVITLLATNGVAAPSGPQNYGALVTGDPAVSRPFSFTAVGACGASITAVLQMQDGSLNLGIATIDLPSGSISTVLTQNFDSVMAPALPTSAGWSAQSGGAGMINWYTTNSLVDSGPNAVFSRDPGNVSSNILISPIIALPLGNNQLTFRQRHAMEADAVDPTLGYDGGVLEIKIGGGAWQDILDAGGSFVSGDYNSVISPDYSNPLGGRSAWSGTSNAFYTTLVNLPAAASGQNIQLRWFFASDNGTSSGGWRIDSIGLSGAVCCVNSPPVLGSATNRTVTELTLMTVTNAALDSGVPSGSLNYSLTVTNTGNGNQVINANISGAGVITWTPTEAQGPGIYQFMTVAANSAAPSLADTNTFLVTVNEVNTPPTLPAISNQTVVELSTLTVTNTATDSDLPANTLTYILENPPANASIDAQGIITFTPSEAQGPSTNTITTIVSDGSASATNSFQVIVTEVNSPPSLPVIGQQTIAELAPLTVTNTASDTDIPANTLSYALIDAPANTAINGQGIITFTPSEEQGPSTNTITTVVSDGTTSATNSFIVIVTEVNTPPTLPVIADQVMNELTTLIITNTASDGDIVGNTPNSLVNDLSYTLINPPAHATIDIHGVITFVPDESQGPSTNVITTVVSDGSANVTNSFTVIVNEVNSAPTLPALGPYVTGELTVLTITNVATDIDVPANVLTYSLVNPPAHATIDAFGIITFAPDEAQGPSTNNIITIVSDGTATATNSVTVIVNEVNTAPVLLAQTDRAIRNYKRMCVTNAAIDADLPSGLLTYSLLNAPASASISDAGIIVWTPNEGNCPHTNIISTVVTDSSGLSATNSFKVVVTEPPVPVIESLTISNGLATIRWSSVRGETYRLQYKNDLNESAWQDVSPDVEADLETATRTEDISGVAQRYYRVILLP